MEDQLLTTAEVARLLRVTVGTVNRYARIGELVAIQLPGGQRRYRLSDVERLLVPAEVEPEATSA